MHTQQCIQQHRRHNQHHMSQQYYYSIFATNAVSLLWHWLYTVPTSSKQHCIPSNPHRISSSSLWPYGLPINVLSYRVIPFPLTGCIYCLQQGNWVIVIRALCAFLSNASVKSRILTYSHHRSTYFQQYNCLRIWKCQGKYYWTSQARQQYRQHWSVSIEGVSWNTMPQSGFLLPPKWPLTTPILVWCHVVCALHTWLPHYRSGSLLNTKNQIIIIIIDCKEEVRSQVIAWKTGALNRAKAQNWYVPLQTVLSFSIYEACLTKLAIFSLSSIKLWRSYRYI